METEGLLLVDKAVGPSSFALIRDLRFALNERKIGHAGTLDPFASGLMILLVSRKWTKRSSLFTGQDKKYLARVRLAFGTDSLDKTGSLISQSTKIPSLSQLLEALEGFQGKIQQIPPMFSAKKINGQRLYTLARQGKSIPRLPQEVELKTQLLSYHYPFIDLSISCSKGTYIRSLAEDLGKALSCSAHLQSLRRESIGPFCLKNSLKSELLRKALPQLLLQEEDLEDYAFSLGK